MKTFFMLYCYLKEHSMLYHFNFFKHYSPYRFLHTSDLLPWEDSLPDNTDALSIKPEIRVRDSPSSDTEYGPECAYVVGNNRF